MKKTISLVVLFITFLSLANAQMTSVGSLYKAIKDKSVICIDARSSADYKKSHISGAINIDVTTLCSGSKMQSASAMASILGSKGLSPSKAIVVYCKTGNRAGRLFFILKYLGASNVKCLHGNMAAWVAARKPVTNKTKTIGAASFSPSVKSSMAVDKAYVQSKVNSTSTIIVDTRSATDYSAGHVDKAINIPYTSFNYPETKLKSKASLTTLFTSAGVTTSKEVIFYCKTSSSASYGYFVLSGLLKYPNVKVYDGGYEDWK